MARARNIKPSFFINEDLVELSFETRLLFIGLWTLCDREGYLEDKPKKIKMAVFPADDVNVDQMLDELQESGFLIRYVAANSKCIFLPTFKKHQNPHHKETISDVPRYNLGQALGMSEASPRLKLDQSQFDDQGFMGFASEEEYNNYLNSVPYVEPECDLGQDLGMPEANPVSTVLIPDSLLLNPDSLNPITDIQEKPSSVAPKFMFKNELKKMGVPDEEATEFIQVRKAKKFVNTENAFKQLLNEAQKAKLTLPQAVELCLKRQNPWGSFKCNWYLGEQQQSRGNTQSLFNNSRSTMQILAEQRMQLEQQQPLHPFITVNQAQPLTIGAYDHE
ncbi:hypothetical protein NI470_05955 [Acinetobacter lwoffii]|uniref:hypothetical protein n=1 Tax=Acinetobacter lwoffii TaxID=28090 RepID=UPI00209BA016|nr:hypothetical protein [Acinetobacter lwoffii]MCO8073036.1 hypothetical protein [Acinetobacter lwoffii]MCO8076150.1 hypothetical protein [Acinetobacter lwoffii]